MRNSILSVLLLVLASCASNPASSSADDRRAIVATVQAFFDVIESGDVEKGRRLTYPNGVFVNVRIEEGRRVLKHFSNEEWLGRLRGRTDIMYEAFDGEPTVLIEGDVAVVWARYVFDMNGKRSHEGTDCFNLLRTEEGWKITGGTYSVEK